MAYLSERRKGKPKKQLTVNAMIKTGRSLRTGKRLGTKSKIRQIRHRRK